MSRSLPIKTSSRAGRFKKKLVSGEALLMEGPQVCSRLGPILELHHQGKLTGAEFVAAYILLYTSLRSPGQWLGSKVAIPLAHELKLPWELIGSGFEGNIRKRLQGLASVGEIFQHFALKSIPLTVNRSLLSWSTGTYPLELMFRIPRPSEVLAQQKHGRRCVTTLVQESQLSQYILGERDALSFTLHDLIHADHFYHHPEVFEGQLGFYGLLDHCIRENHFPDHLKTPRFETELEYVISDMNAYAVHLMKCFKAALTHYHESGSDFFTHWLTKLNPSISEREALIGLNSVAYDPETQDRFILEFLAKWRVAPP